MAGSPYIAWRVGFMSASLVAAERSIQETYREAARSLGWDHPLFAAVREAQGAITTARELSTKVNQDAMRLSDDTFAERHVQAPAPVRVPEDGAKLAEDLREASAEVRSWPADQQRSQGVRGIAPPRHNDGSPVPEDGAEGAERDRYPSEIRYDGQWEPVIEWLVGNNCWFNLAGMRTVERIPGDEVLTVRHPDGVQHAEVGDFLVLADGCVSVRVGEVRVPVEARDHDVMPSDEDLCDCEGPRLDITRCSLCDRRYPRAPAPVSEEPEGAWTPPRSRCAGGPFGTGGGNA